MVFSRVSRFWEFYECLGLQYCKANNIFEGFNINFKRSADAGKNIATKLNAIVEHNQEIVSAICDSDKTYYEERHQIKQRITCFQQ